VRLLSGLLAAQTPPKAPKQSFAATAGDQIAAWILPRWYPRGTGLRAQIDAAGSLTFCYCYVVKPGRIELRSSGEARSRKTQRNSSAGLRAALLEPLPVFDGFVARHHGGRCGWYYFGYLRAARNDDAASGAVQASTSALVKAVSARCHDKKN